MEESIRMPKDRKNLTGRHVNPESLNAEHRKEILLEHEEAIREHPEEARLVRELLQSFQFDAVKDMYEEINLRSAGPLKDTGPKTGENPLLRSRPRVPTNEITSADIFFVPASGKGSRNTSFMSYAALGNVFRINLRAHDIKILLEIEKKPRPLTENQAHIAKLILFDFYHGVFHELGHAYGFMSETHHPVGDTHKYVTSQSNIARRKTKIEFLKAENITRYRFDTDLEYWLEGFNDLQSFLIMRDYLVNHSLSFSDIQVPRDTKSLWKLYDEVIPHQQYGAMVIATERILDYISEQTEIPFAVVMNSFRQLFQTKGGPQILVTELQKILGSEITRRIQDTSPDDLANSDVLSVDILKRLQTDPKLVTFVEEFVTRPSRNKKSPDSGD